MTHLPPVDLVGTAVLAAVLLATILFDLRKMRIPNPLSYVIVALFLVIALTDPGIPDLWTRLAISGGVLLIGFIGFVLRLVGGGDVKIMASLALFVPVAQLPVIMLTFSATLILGTVAVVLLRRLAGTQDSNWAFLRTRRMPMGLPIGLAGLLAPVVTGGLG